MEEEKPLDFKAESNIYPTTMAYEDKKFGINIIAN